MNKMDPFRRTFQFDAQFPFQYVYRDAKNAQHELPDHVHDWYELVYIYSGKGTFFIDHSFYEANAGDIFLIPGNTIHRSFPVEEDPKRASAFYFSAAFVHEPAIGDSFHYLRAFEIAKAKQAFRTTLPVQYRVQFEQLIERIHIEIQEALTGYRHAVRMHIQQMLLLLSRYSEDALGTPSLPLSTALLPPWLERALSYMHEHLEEQDLSLAALARKAAVTPAHFSRIFKRLTGMNVTDYVTAKRIMKAKELLQLNDRNIAEIAESCGFGSVPHFHRKFKNLTGMTPAQYKRTI